MKYEELYIEENKLEELHGELRQMPSAVVIPSKRSWRWIAGELAKIDAVIDKYTFSEAGAKKQGIDMADTINMEHVYDEGEFCDIVREILDRILPECWDSVEASYYGNSAQFLAAYQRSIGATADDPDALLSKAGQRALWRLTVISEILSARNVREASVEEIFGWWRAVGKSVEGLFFMSEDEDQADMIDGSSALWKLFKDVCDELDRSDGYYVNWEYQYWWEHYWHACDNRGKIPMSIFEHIIESLEEKYGSEDEEDDDDE